MRLRILILLLLIVTITAGYSFHMETPDQYDRNRIVLLKSEKGSCTGVQIKAPSGRAYTLTARHCKELLNNRGFLTAVSEDDSEKEVRVIAIDPKSDLMLLAPVSKKRTVVIADRLEDRHQKVHTMTHGGGMPSYRTEGELLIEQDLDVLLFPVFDAETTLKCTSSPQTRIVDLGMMQGCAVVLHLMTTTASVIPGSSGGPMFNDSEELIGIVSATAGQFSGMVTLADIHRFLRNR